MITGLKEKIERCDGAHGGFASLYSFMAEVFILEQARRAGGGGFWIVL